MDGAEQGRRRGRLNSSRSGDTCRSFSAEDQKSTAAGCGGDHHPAIVLWHACLSALRHQPHLRKPALVWASIPACNRRGRRKGRCCRWWRQRRWQSEYNYSASFAIGLCEGPVSAIGEVYVSKQITTLGHANGVLFAGAQGQAPVGLSHDQFSGEALGYTELAYVGFPTSPSVRRQKPPNSASRPLASRFLAMATRMRPPIRYSSIFSPAAACRPLTSIPSPTSPAIAGQWASSSRRCSISSSRRRMAQGNHGDPQLPSLSGSVARRSLGRSLRHAGERERRHLHPRSHPSISLGDDDFIRDGDVDPITVTRTDCGGRL